jgi:hypothetical protein
LLLTVAWYAAGIAGTQPPKDLQSQPLRNEQAGLLAALGPLRAEADGLAAQRAEAVHLQAGLQQLRAQRDALAATSAEAERPLSRWPSCELTGSAVKGSTSWSVNGSSRDGARMIREFSKLMLRAYNNEADNAVHSMKPYTLESSVAPAGQVPADSAAASAEAERVTLALALDRTPRS